MKVVELNEGRKIEYELNGTKLDFADGTLTVNLAKYQRDSDITKTVIGDKDGNLLLIDKPDTLPKKNADGRFYVAIVEIPATEYEKVEVEGEAENVVMAAAEVADENVISSISQRGICSAYRSGMASIARRNCPLCGA